MLQKLETRLSLDVPQTDGAAGCAKCQLGKCQQDPGHRPRVAGQGGQGLFRVGSLARSLLVVAPEAPQLDGPVVRAGEEVVALGMYGSDAGNVPVEEFVQFKGPVVTDGHHTHCHVI